jgi:hypothetical protein
MSVNSIPVSRRTLPLNPQIQANGSYTLPQQIHIPHPVLQQIGSGHVANPLVGGVPSRIGTVAAIAARPYPTPDMPGVHGIRMVNTKVSPGS